MAKRTSLAIALASSACWVAPSFVSLASGVRSRVPEQIPAGNARPQSTNSAEAFAAPNLVTIGLLAIAAGAGTRSKATARRFFGGGSATPAKPTSYRDFQDPWLGSADLSFDPLNLAVQGGIFDTASTAVPETTYYNYRESEVKHGRFAMTAFLAIFGESADRGALLRQMGNVGIEDKLDGTLGLDEVQLPILLIGLGYQALAEYNLQRAEQDGNILSVEYKKERIPGDLGFDPLGLSKGAGADVKGLHNVEVNTGRLAMIGITTFLLKEFVVKDPQLAAQFG